MPMLAAADNYFVDGACWAEEVAGVSGPNYTPATYYSETKISGDTIIDGVSALKVYENDRLDAIIRVDGDKVYALMYKGIGNIWVLAYDFSMREGDICEIGWFDGYVHSNSTSPGTRYFVKCLSVSPNEKYGGWPTIHFAMADKIEDLTDEDADWYPMGEGDWLIGIGNVAGVDFNHFTNDVGGGGGRLLSFTYNDEVICQYVNDSLGDEVEATALSVSIDGLIADVTGAEPGSDVHAYAADGSLAASAKAASDGQATLTLQHPGLYLIATTSTTVKVLAR